MEINKRNAAEMPSTLSEPNSVYSTDAANEIILLLVRAFVQSDNAMLESAKSKLQSLSGAAPSEKAVRRQTYVEHISYAPRGLSRDEAARYVGVGPTKFDQMVSDGRMPKPKRIDGRVVWDRLKIEAAFSDLPDDARINPLDRMLSHR